MNNNENYYYTVYDRLAKTYAPLFMAYNDDVALRHFMRMLAETNADTITDFELHRRGSFSERSGIFNLNPLKIDVDYEAVQIKVDSYNEHIEKMKAIKTEYQKVTREKALEEENKTGFIKKLFRRK